MKRPTILLVVVGCIAGGAPSCGEDGADSTQSTSSAGQGAAGGGAPLTCGDLVVDAGEDCDDGDADDADGCTAACRFGCAGDTECGDDDPCNGAEVCEDVPEGRRCNVGQPAADGLACDGGTCLGGQCKPLSCGNAELDDTEDCDDGDAQALDGCDATCRYELLLRLTQMAIPQGPAPSWCTSGGNQFGNTFTVEALSVINDDLNVQIGEASLNLMLAVLELDDLAGGDDENLKLGVVAGTLDPASATPWTAGAIDGWFLAEAGTLDANGKPVSVLTPASLAGGMLQAGASDVTIPLLLGAQPAPLAVLRAQLRASIDAGADVPAPPPEQLASNLTVMRSIDATGSDQGMCGDATVESLAKIPLPAAFSIGGSAACNAECDSKAYTYCGEGMPVGAGCNSLLDAMVGGCEVNPPDCIPVFTASQPDVGSAGDPPATLTNGAGNKVTPPVPTDAYSAYFRFAANRAHLTNNVR
jgi:cysteine-rich repeat protein